MQHKLLRAIRWLRYPYSAAILLAVAAQAARIPFHLTTAVPFITYAPFVVVSALFGGLGPGIVTTILCALEVTYFSLEPMGSLAINNPSDWHGVGAFLLNGLVTSMMAERLKRDKERMAESQRKTRALLESLPDGFVALDRDWNYTYVNPAATRMLGMASEQLTGKNIWMLWPHAANSAFGEVSRRAVTDNVPLQVDWYYPEPLNAWFEVRCYPSPEGLTLFFKNTTDRRRSKERLRLLESATLQTNDGILIVQQSGTDGCRPSPILTNPAFERMTGFSLEELQQGALALPCGPGPIASGREEDLRKPCPTQMQQQVRRKDGSLFWAEWSFGPLAGEDGGNTHCVWTCRDISARKLAEEESELFTSIVGSSDDAIVSENLDGTILSWNKGAERIYGYASGEIVGRPISVLVPPDLAYELPLLTDDLRRGSRIEHYETERLRKDAGRIFVSLTMSPIQDSEQRIVGVSVIGRDITERKLAERAVSLSEERYRSLILATSQIVWTMNSGGEFVEDMPMWREFTGQAPDEIQGRGWMDALHPDDRERIGELWSRSIRRRAPCNTEFRLRRHDGDYRYMSVHGVPVLERDGAIREWVGTCADITARVLAEEEVDKLHERLEKRVVERTAELEAANRELEAFAYSVSHDLRAPLRAVDGFSRILLDEYGPQLPAEAQHYLEVARNNAVQMGELIDGLLSFSRLGRQPVRKQVVKTGDLVRQVLEDFRPERTGRQVEITVGCLPACAGDPLLLKQVFTNLLSNALKYTRTRDVAKIEIASADSKAYYVRDNGVGFDMRYADKLFGVFQRLHKAEEYEGTGVGLAIVQRIIHRLGGRVWAESELNQGATFYFTLAAAPNTAYFEDPSMTEAREQVQS